LIFYKKTTKLGFVASLGGAGMVFVYGGGVDDS